MDYSEIRPIFATMKQVNELIEDVRIREDFERYYKAETAQERQAITDEYKRWFNSLTEEEQKTETALMIENTRMVLEGVKANNKELDALHNLGRRLSSIILI